MAQTPPDLLELLDRAGHDARREVDALAATHGAEDDIPAVLRALRDAAAACASQDAWCAIAAFRETRQLARTARLRLEEA